MDQSSTFHPRLTAFPPSSQRDGVALRERAENAHSWPSSSDSEAGCWTRFLICFERAILSPVCTVYERNKTSLPDVTANSARKVLLRGKLRSRTLLSSVSALPVPDLLSPPFISTHLRSVLQKGRDPRLQKSARSPAFDQVRTRAFSAERKRRVSLSSGTLHSFSSLSLSLQLLDQDLRQVPRAMAKDTQYSLEQVQQVSSSSPRQSTFSSVKVPTRSSQSRCLYSLLGPY